MASSSEQGADFPPIVLAFAASDPSGGAGIQADVLTLASMGCHPLSVLTAVTVQDTLGVEGVQPLEAEWVADQARCLLEDMPVDVFKIGVLGSVENITAIAEILSDYPDVPLILDPVLASGRGDELASEDMLHALRELLLPRTTVLTPNSTEARRLAEAEEDEEPSLASCAQRLIEIGCEYVLITGTHEPTPQVVNTLYGKAGVVRTDSWERRCSPTGSSWRKPSAKRRNTPGTRSPRHTGPGWASFCPIVCSGRAKRSPIHRLAKAKRRAHRTCIGTDSTVTIFDGRITDDVLR
jgi:hydroxymethylpyrimidine/phosphomethylpyrimidine kinase